MRRLENELEDALRTATTVQDALLILEELLSGGYNALPDGRLYYIKELVGQVNNLKIYIYAEDHPPPHFHIRGGDIDAMFSIEDCSLLRGDIAGRQRGLVVWWHKRSKPVLVAAWKRNQPA